MRQNCRSFGAISIRGRTAPFTVKISSTGPTAAPHPLDGISTSCRNLGRIRIMLNETAAHNDHTLM